MHQSCHRFALALAPLLSLVCARNELLVGRAAQPISVSPSQLWEGVDGPWSSFAISVGTPPQAVRVFVSTASQETFVVLSEGCAPGDNSCPSARGGIFNPNSSSTWSQYSYFQLPIEKNLYGQVTGLFGNDTLNLTTQGSPGPSLENQVIGGLGNQTYYLGLLGVNPKATKVSASDSGQSSYITSLKAQNIIPSVSFGFTAGAAYRLKKVLGSLTLGGYDQSRFTPNDLSFSLASDQLRDLVVGIQSITSIDQKGTSSSLLPSGILAYIDSTVPEIWLPIEACQAFEKTFQLTYDKNSSLYLVNDNLHNSLVAQNASVSFTLGQAKTGGDTINITLPYRSFDLQITPPVVGVGSATRYFPLRRADNDTQYTIGRTFLQEAYLIVDWERKNFSLSQCLFQENSPTKLIAIEAAPASSNSNVPAAPAKTSSSGHGKTIGIAVGVTVSVVVIAFIFAVVVFRRRRRKSPTAATSSSKSRDNLATSQQGSSAKELNAKENAIHELEGPDRPQIVQTNTPRPLPPWAPEKEDYAGGRTEMDQAASEPSQSEPLLGPVHEMYGSPASPVELPTNSLGELPASPITRNVSSAASSSSRRRSRGLFQSRSSTPGFLPSPASTTSPNTLPGGPPATNRSTAAAPPAIELFSPISPIAEGESSKSSSRLKSIFGGLSQPGGASSQRPPDDHAS